MSEPRKQYRPNVQPGGKLADAAPEIIAVGPKIPTAVIISGLLLLGVFALLAALMLEDTWRTALLAIGILSAGTGVLTWLMHLYLKPVPQSLPNGHTVMRPRSRLVPVLIFMVPTIWLAMLLTKFDAGILIRRGDQFTVILQQIFQPNFSYFDKVWPPLLDTVKMSLMGSALGSFAALPFAVFASANINHTAWVVAVLRILLNIVRALPTLIIASVCALIFGLGTFAGTVAITVFTFGIVAKMLYESIETIDMGPFEAMESMGASRFEAFWSACMPQILPTYLSHSLYSFETNIRSASILGYVGAGGLGILISERIGWRDYQSLGTVLLALFATVLVIDNLSGYFRKKLS